MLPLYTGKEVDMFFRYNMSCIAKENILLLQINNARLLNIVNMCHGSRG